MTVQHWTDENIPDQTGRVAVVTGANTGIGYSTAAHLARRGATVVLAVRDTAKGEQAAARIRAERPRGEVEVQQLDLSSLASVHAAAATLGARHDHLDLLVNNAGVMYTPFRRTADGFELQFGTNHLGHFALTGLLLDRLLVAPGARVVTVSSIGHRYRSALQLDDVRSERRYSRTAAYGRSKLANLLFTYELQRRLSAAGADLIALAAHPGVAATELGRNSPAPLRALLGLVDPVLQTPDMGALPTLRAATDPAAVGGSYYGPGGFGGVAGHPTVVASSARSHDAGLQAQLWAASQELTGVQFEVTASVRDTLRTQPGA